MNYRYVLYILICAVPFSFPTIHRYTTETLCNEAVKTTQSEYSPYLFLLVINDDNMEMSYIKPWKTNNNQLLTIPERKSRSKTKMGVKTSGQAPERHHSGLQRGLRPQHHGKEARRVRALESRSEGQDEEDRLFKTGR